jgi:chromosome segregation ATPase
MNKEAKSIAVYRADALRLEAVIKEKDQEIVALNAKSRDSEAVIRAQRTTIAQLEERIKAYNRNLANALSGHAEATERIKGPRGCPEGHKEDNRE